MNGKFPAVKFRNVHWPRKTESDDSSSFPLRTRSQQKLRRIELLLQGEGALMLAGLMGASLIIQKFSESFSGSLKRETGSKLSLQLAANYMSSGS